MTSETAIPAAMPALHRVSSVEAVMVVLREQIFEGLLPAGLPLREASLSEQLNVSRHTIRVALTNLSHEGVVRLEANRGAFVRELSPEDVDDCYRLRELLELAAIEAIVGKPDLLRPVHAALKSMVQAGREGSWNASRDADLEFHRQIVAALGSRLILSTYESLLTDLRLCFLVEGFKLKDHLGNAAEHAQLLEVIEKGDLPAALDSMRSHLEHSRLDALAALERD